MNQPPAAPSGVAARRPRRRFVHTSDVHLGAYDVGGDARRTRLHRAFSRVIDLVRRERADFLVIAGDFLDNPFVRDDTLAFAMDEIARTERPVVLLPGNHDPVGPGSVYDRIGPARRPANLVLLDDPAGACVTLDGLGVEVWARAHGRDDFAPAAAAPPRGAAPWQIAIVHGHLVGPGRTSSASFQVTPADLAATRRDYVALGHWEHLTRVPAGARVVAAYSGAPLALGPGGDRPGHALVVDLDPGGAVSLTAHPLNGGPPLPHDAIPVGRYE